MKIFLNVVFAVAMVAISRLIPHWPNLTAIGASVIWMTYSFPQKNYSILVPILALFLSDLIIGFHGQMIPVYGTIIISSIFIQKFGIKFSPKSLIKTSLFSTLLFFLITNFSVWLTGELYNHSFAGLVHCYIAALPFAINDFLGTLVYSSLGLLIIEKVFQTNFVKQNQH